MEEYRHYQSGNQYRRQTARQFSGAQLWVDNLCRRPSWPRHALCHRLAQAPVGTRLGTLTPVRGGYRKNRPLVPRQPGLARQCYLGGVSPVL